MRLANLREKIGIKGWYVPTRGIGGVVKAIPEDFVVIEAMAFKPTQLSKKPRRYVYCIMRKRATETLRAIQEIERKLSLKNGLIGFSGIKDKWALTYQWISIPHLAFIRLTEQPLRTSEIALFPVGWHGVPIFTGVHLGNFFRIRIREVSGEPSDIHSELEQFSRFIASNPLPNFFGYQRFGLSEPFTHQIGREIIKRNFTGVLRFLERGLYLTTYKTKEKKHMVYSMEKGILRKIRSLPLRTLRLFVHSYQSYIFNRILSKRIQARIPIGKPVEGDIVYSIKRRKFLFFDGENFAGIIGPYLPLIGFKTRMGEGKPWKIVERVLDEEGVKPEQFKLRNGIGIDFPGGLRPAYLQVKNFKVWYKGSSRLVLLFFYLPKGGYASIVLEELTKNEDVYIGDIST